MRSIVVLLSAIVSSCAWTSASVNLPDGTNVQFWDNKSREGVMLNWQRNEDGSYTVFLTSQKSGTDAEIAKVATGVTRVLEKTIDKVPVVPVP